MKFPSKWSKLIENLIQSPVFSIIADGESQGYFGSTNGLRQGDPLSPLLFTFIMEYFTLLLEEKVRSGLLNPIKDHGNVMTHLIYADDIIIFTKANLPSAIAIKDVFKTIQNVTGLDLTCEKSSLCIRKGER